MKLFNLLFYWSFVDARGRWRQGYVWASTARAVKERLAFFPVSVASVTLSWLMFFYPVQWWCWWNQLHACDVLTFSELAFFCTQMHALLAGGLSLHRSLSVLAHASVQGRVKEATAETVAAMDRGHSASGAFLQGRRWWPRVIALGLQALEHGGDSAVFFKEVSMAFQLAARHRSDLAYALVGPVLTAVGAAGVLLFAWHVCVSCALTPMSTATFPVPIFVGASVALIGALMALWYLCAGNQRLLVWRDFFVLRIPFFGPLFSYADALVFFNVSALLLFAGLDVVRTFEAVQPLLGNAYWRLAIRAAGERLEKGADFVVTVQAIPSVCIPVTFSEAVVTARCARDVGLLCQNAARMVSIERERRLGLLRTTAPIVMMLVVGIFILFFVTYLYQTVLTALPGACAL